ncbi:type VI secretion system Vgr family protein [Amaricoccus solimangrovi]|uniref:Type VI secretion system tip protein VgrG n=1 Tax=Amaricoccus solimangrovi TaxID=2589815 RepID=A0A501WQ19_9RHOB|nr:type VI secretion system tip protein VgrG [Amaricoccus solimangrovi]TPE49111.1 type VI secretion system tip protein VgrG [Amaricoccus solimangrovi]
MPEDRAVTVESPTGSQLTFTRLVGFDGIGLGFGFTAGFSSADPDVDVAGMLGRPMAIEAGVGDSARWFHGLVTAFRLTGFDRHLAFYEAELRPWLWKLGLTHDCRVFQNLTAVEIIEQIFGKYPEAKFEKRLQKVYPPREYCVQFDESDLAFVRRLMEHEGIFDFFEYAEDGHTLILTDTVAKLAPPPGCESVPFRAADAYRGDEALLSWELTGALLPKAYAHTDYDFEKPGLSLLARSEAEPVAGAVTGEHYRQPGAHLELDRGDAVAAIRLEELQAPRLRIRARGTVRALASGHVFTLTDFPREDQNEKHLVLRAEYRVVSPGFDPAATEGETGEPYRCELTLAPAAVPFRPPRATPRPVMRGPQTATVVGPSGEEIFTDQYARVKVQFHWDRLGHRDENSSCFVRVSSAWAGGGWGFIQIPRIGQEVIVDFLDGDPDRPIITGRVYNAAEMPPYGLPGSATQSGWKSNSSPGGGGYNEFMFEDKAGSELVNFQAQKDHALLVKNDRSKLVQHDQSDRIDNNATHSVGVNLDEDVGNNKTVKVGVDQTTQIGSNDSETVGANRSLSVGADETISVGANSTETIGANHTQTVALVQTVTVGAARVDTVGAAEARTVGAAQVNTIGATRSVSVGVSQSHDIGASDSWQIGADQGVKIGGGQNSEISKTRSVKIGEDDSSEVTGQHALKIGKDSLIQVGKNGSFIVGENLTIEAKKNVTIKCGSAEIMMKDDGTITVKGKNISVDDKGDTSMKASGKISMKGPSGINQN